MSNLGQATTQKNTFSRQTSIQQVIQASPATVWNLLTNASQYSNWNSTIIKLEGKIEQGGKIKLTSTLDPNRVFKLKVKEFVPNQKLVWGDAMGTRIYTLEAQGNNTLFGMEEKIGGLLFPLFASHIPSFDASFEQFVVDLKQAAEASTS
jgi:uncharacterized protein YndB with AHSA1/START domain